MLEVHVRFAALLALLALGCQPQAESQVPGHYEPATPVLGTAGDHPIDEAMIAAVERRMPPGRIERAKETGQYQQFLDQVAVGQLLYAEALARGIHQDPEVVVLLAMAQRDVLAAELLDRIGEEAVTEEKILEAYETHAVQFRRPAVKARHIVVADLMLAQEIEAKLAAGEEFAALAAQYSTDRGTAVNGGDLGWFERERMFREIADPAMDATPGTLLGPIETRMGHHLVLVEDRRDSRPLEEVRETLEGMIKKEVVEAYVAELQSEGAIEWTSSEPSGGDGAVLDEEITPPDGGHE